MIRMTRQSDYGIVLLATFAQEGQDSPLAARDLSERTHLPLPMVGKILKTLVRAGILTSQRGVHGGYQLSRPADKISVAEIITALEGAIGITECTGDEATNCNLLAMCAVKNNWEMINHVVRHALGGISLAQMAGPIERESLALAVAEQFHHDSESDAGPHSMEPSS